jgi:hypothetical protein
MSYESLSTKRANLAFDEAKHEELAITAGIDKVRQLADGALDGVPNSLIEGTLRLAAEDAENGAAWRARDDNPSRWNAVLKRVADHLGQMRDDLLSNKDATGDDAGLAPDMADAVAEVRRRAGCPDAPTSMVLGLLLRKLGRDGDSAASYNGRGENPENWRASLTRVSNELRDVWAALAKAWNPKAPGTPSDFDGTDALNMSDESWSRYKRSVARK